MIQSQSSKDGSTVSRDQAIKYSQQVNSASELSRILQSGHCRLLVQCLQGTANPSDHTEPRSGSLRLSWQKNWVLLEILRNL